MKAKCVFSPIVLALLWATGCSTTPKERITWQHEYLQGQAAQRQYFIDNTDCENEVLQTGQMLKGTVPPERQQYGGPFTPIPSLADTMTRNAAKNQVTQQVVKSYLSCMMKRGWNPQVVPAR